MTKKKIKSSNLLRGYVERLPGIHVIEAWVNSPRLMRVDRNWCGVGGPYMIPGRGAYMAREFKEATREQYTALAAHARSEGNLAVLIIDNTGEDAIQNTESDTSSDSGTQA